METETFSRQVAAVIAHRILSQTSMAFSNVVGPLEEISFYGHPMAYLAPSVYGHPHVRLLDALIGLKIASFFHKSKFTLSKITRGSLSTCRPWQSTTRAMWTRWQFLWRWTLKLFPTLISSVMTWRSASVASRPLFSGKTKRQYLLNHSMDLFLMSLYVLTRQESTQVTYSCPVKFFCSEPLEVFNLVGSTYCSCCSTALLLLGILPWASLLLGHLIVIFSVKEKSAVVSFPDELRFTIFISCIYLGLNTELK